MSFHNNPTFRGPGNFKPFQTRTPVGKLGAKFTNIPRAGTNVPLFGVRPKPIEQIKANTPAFRGPAKLPSNFLKNIPLLGITQSINPRAAQFNGPLAGLHGRIPSTGLHGRIPLAGLHGRATPRLGRATPRLGHGKSVSRTVKRKGRKKK